MPTFGAESFVPPTARQQENRRIGGVAFVLLVSLLVVAGAVMGINYAATNRETSARTASALSPKAAQPRVVLERLPANALVAPAASAAQVAKAVSQATTIPSTTPPQLRSAATKTVTAVAGSPEPLGLESPWQKGKSAGASSTRSQKANAKAASRIKATSIDTETPLIMD